MRLPDWLPHRRKLSDYQLRWERQPADLTVAETTDREGMGQEEGEGELLHQTKMLCKLDWMLYDEDNHFTMYAIEFMIMYHIELSMYKGPLYFKSSYCSRLLRAQLPCNTQSIVKFIYIFLLYQRQISGYPGCCVIGHLHCQDSTAWTFVAGEQTFLSHLRKPFGRKGKWQWTAGRGQSV